MTDKETQASDGVASELNAELDVKPMNMGGSATGHCLTGRIYHALKKETQDGSTWDKALCGSKPRKRSYGWMDIDAKYNPEINCSKCLKQMRVSK